MSAISQFFGGIKSIQRGVIAVSPGAYTGTATITGVNTAKSELRLLGVDGGTNGYGVVGPLVGRVQLTDSTTITFNSTFASSGPSSVSWELTEFN